MKKLKLFQALLLSVFLCGSISAQTKQKVNIADQPGWGSVGYEYVEYYYLPDLETYYSVSKQKFIYLEKSRWVKNSILPLIFINYDIYSGRKVVLNEPKPYLKHEEFKVKYISTYKRTGVKSIRDSHDPKYFINKNHPEHANWLKDHNYKMPQLGQNTWN